MSARRRAAVLAGLALALVATLGLLASNYSVTPGSAKAGLLLIALVLAGCAGAVALPLLRR